MSRVAFLAKKVTDQDATIRYTNSGSALEAGAPIKINVSTTKSIAGVAVEDIAASAVGTFDVKNIYDFPCGSAQTFSAGDQVYWDNEGSKAIPSASANGTDDFCLGTCEKARAATDKAFVRVRLNFGPEEFTRTASSSSSASS